MGIATEKRSSDRFLHKPGLPADRWDDRSRRLNRLVGQFDRVAVLPGGALLEGITMLNVGSAFTSVVGSIKDRTQL